MSTSNNFRIILCWWPWDRRKNGFLVCVIALSNLMNSINFYTSIIDDVIQTRKYMSNRTCIPLSHNFDGDVISAAKHPPQMIWTCWLQRVWHPVDAWTFEPQEKIYQEPRLGPYTCKPWQEAPFTCMLLWQWIMSQTEDVSGFIL